MRAYGPVTAWGWRMEDGLTCLDVGRRMVTTRCLMARSSRSRWRVPRTAGGADGAGAGAHQVYNTLRVGGGLPVTSFSRKYHNEGKMGGALRSYVQCHNSMRALKNTHKHTQTLQSRWHDVSAEWLRRVRVRIFWVVCMLCACTGSMTRGVQTSQTKTPLPRLKPAAHRFFCSNAIIVCIALYVG